MKRVVIQYKVKPCEVPPAVQGTSEVGSFRLFESSSSGKQTDAGLDPAGDATSVTRRALRR